MQNSRLLLSQYGHGDSTSTVFVVVLQCASVALKIVRLVCDRSAVNCCTTTTTLSTTTTLICLYHSAANDSAFASQQSDSSGTSAWERVVYVKWADRLSSF